MDCHGDSAWTPISEELKLHDSLCGLLLLPLANPRADVGNGIRVSDDHPLY